MFILILCLVYTVVAQRGPPPVPANSDDAPHVYSRVYLRGLKRVENERIQTQFINMGITHIENGVFTAAKQGLVKYTTERFEGCETYEFSPMRLDKDVCENIVNGIRSLVSERFPDSQVIYDATTKQYTLEWD